MHRHSPPAKKGHPTKSCSSETLRETNAVYPRLVETRGSPVYDGESGRFDKQKLSPYPGMPCLEPNLAIARTGNLMFKSRGWLPLCTRFLHPIFKQSMPSMPMSKQLAKSQANTDLCQRNWAVHIRNGGSWHASHQAIRGCLVTISILTLGFSKKV